MPNRTRHFRDSTSVLTCGAGTQYELDLAGEGSSATAISVTSAQTWTFEVPTTGKWKGSWTVIARLAGTASSEFSCTVKHRDSGCTVIDTIMNAEGSGPITGITEVTFGPIDPGILSPNATNIVTIEIVQTVGTAGQCLVDGDAGVQANSRCSIPYPTIERSVTGIDVDAHRQMVWPTPSTPIANWIVPPIYEIQDGETAKVGVVAFARNQTGDQDGGIDKVRFTITGQGYGGTSPIDVSAMTLDSMLSGGTQCWAYWTPIAESDFSSAGPITITAAAYSKDGVIRDEDTSIYEAQGGIGDSGFRALEWLVDYNGGLDTPEAWVDKAGGVDAQSPLDAGVVNTGIDPSLPYATIHGAIKAIRVWNETNGNGHTVEGGIVNLKASEDHVWTRTDDDRYNNFTRYLTIRAAAGGSPSDTRINGASTTGVTQVYWLRITNITIGTTASSYNRIGGRPGFVWFDSCVIDGGTRAVGALPLGDLQAATGLWYSTVNTYQNVYDAMRAVHMSINDTVSMVARDVWQAVKTVVNCTVDDLDNTGIGGSADLLQNGNSSGETVNNLVFFGIKGTNIRQQGLRVIQEGGRNTANAIAIVNYFLGPKGSETHSNGLNLKGQMYNVLVAHVTLQGSTGNQAPRFSLGQVASPRRDFIYGDMSISNSHFNSVFLKGVNQTYGTPVDELFNATVDNNSFDENNYWNLFDGAPERDTPGTNVTTDDPQLVAGGYPLGGLLMKRTTPLVVPIDVVLTERRTPSAIGAYEGVPRIDVADRHSPRGARRGILRGAY